jgi:hypothetical protein
MHAGKLAWHLSEVRYHLPSVRAEDPVPAIPFWSPGFAELVGEIHSGDYAVASAGELSQLITDLGRLRDAVALCEQPEDAEDATVD